jgi:outer membrane protein assembly factor BamB
MAALKRYTLTLSPNGRMLFAANPALGVVAAIDLDTLRVTRVARFAPSLSGRPTRQLAAGTISRNGRTLYFSAGNGLWAYDAAYGRVRGPYPTGGPIVGFGYGVRDRTVHALRTDGKMITFDAATGRRR